MKKVMAICLMSAAAALGWGGCGESNLVPMRPIEMIEVWEADEVVPTTAPATQGAATQPETQASTQATTEPATQTAGTQPATQPGRLVVKRVDPNQTARFVYRASYDNIWEQARLLLTKSGFRIDRQDYRLGVMTTHPLASSHVIEPWRGDHANAKNAVENTLHSQRRIVRLTISKAPKPDFYEVAIQVVVERVTNPTEELGGPIFVEGSGFGRNALSLRSDYITGEDQKAEWNVVGRDAQLEKKLLDALFNRI